jgi:hypothetical protein
MSYQHLRVEEREELGRQLRPMTEHAFDYLFVAKTNLLTEATPEQRACVRDVCARSKGLASPYGVLA